MLSRNPYKILIVIFIYANTESIVFANEDINLLAQDNISFDSTALFGNSQGVDLSRFKSKDYIEPGTYKPQVFLNKKKIGDLDVAFQQNNSSKSAILCIDKVLLKHLDLSKKALAQLPEKECLNIKDIHPDANYAFDLAQLQLDISIPQLFVIDRPKGYIDPDLFSDGVASAFLGYNFNYNKNNDNENKYLALNGGLNAFGWFFRHSGSFNSTNSGLGEYISNKNVLYKDMTAIHSRLSLGQFSTQNYNTDNIQILGAQLSSDSSMLPWSERSYSPEIENVAHTNALIRIHQNGQKIYEKSVPAGPFKITDLTSFSDGDLTLEIIESTGEKRYFTIPFKNNLNLLKKGRLDYNLAAGKYYPTKQAGKDQQKINDYIFQNNINYGISNYVTGLFGLNVAPDYYSVLLGGSFSTAIGGIGLQTEYQDADILNTKLQGHRYSLNYSNEWKEQNLHFGFNYALYNQHYLNLSNFLYLKNNSGTPYRSDDSEQLNFNYTYNLKDSYGISISKSFTNSKLGYFQFSLRQNNYWDSQNDLTQYSFFYNNSFKTVSYNLGVTQSSYSNSVQKDDLNMYLSMSIPMEWHGKSFSLHNNTQQNTNNYQTSSNTTINGTLGTNNEFSFGLGLKNNLNNKQNQSDSVLGYSTYRLPQVTLSSTVNIDEQNTQYSASANGAIVAHPYGISLANFVPDTYTIIHASQGKGAKIQNAWGVKVDRFGNAIYSGVTPYVVNTISLDPSDLPLNVSLDANQSEVIPKKYSSQLALFDTKTTSNILLTISSSTYENLPIGSQLIGSDGKVIGMLGPTSQLMVENEESLKEPSQLIWGDEEKQSCSLAPVVLDPKQTNENSGLNIVNVECK